MNPNLNFMRYPSLTNHYAISEKNRAIYENKDKQWYATEKVDGSNISITVYLSTGEWAFGKRSAIITKDEGKPFDALLGIVSEDDISQMKNILVSLGYRGTAHIYGELFGDGIQAQDYEASINKTKDVILYDVLVVETEELATELGLDELAKVIPEKFKEKVIKQDTLSNLINQAPSDASLYGGANEGYVYKLVEGYPTYTVGSSYPVVKHKTDAYLENKGVKKTEKKPKVALSEIQESMLSYVTEQRVANILSHGDIELDMKSMGSLIKAFREDIVKEWLKESGSESGLSFDQSLDETKPLTRDIAVVAKQQLRKQMLANN